MNESLKKQHIIKHPSDNLMVVIMGEAGSGKDTFANYITQEFSKENYVTHRITFANKLKDEAYLLGWDGKKDEKGRALLQDLGKVMKNYHGQDYYAKQAFVNDRRIKDHPNLWIITDARFLSEINHCRKKAEEYGAELKIVKIDRSQDKTWHSDLTDEQKKDISEQEWRQTKPDIVVMNDGKDPTFGNFKF